MSIDLEALRRKLQLLRDTIAGLEAAGEGDQVLGPLRQRQFQIEQQIITGGGAAVMGDVAAREFVGRDKVLATLASGSFIIGGDANGLIVVNVQGERERLPPDRVPTATLLQAYYRFLSNECRVLPLGIIDTDFVSANPQETVRLPDVYVDLDVIPSAPREEESARGWALRLVRGVGEGGGRIAALDALDGQSRAVLIGDAGSGKTTFVNYLTYLLANPDETLRASLPDALRDRLVVRLVLRDVAAEHVPPDARRGDAGMLWQALEADIGREFGPRAAALLLSAIQERLWREGGLVLLDGLDEAPEASRRRQTLLEAIAAFAAALPEETGRVVVTARPYAYADPAWRLDGFATLALAPFDARQQARFVQRWHRAVRPAMGWSEEMAGRKGQGLQDALGERPYLADLATRPLLLTLMATLHSSRGKLPEDRADLYEQTVDLLLARWQRAREVARADGELVVEPGIRQVLAAGEGPIRSALDRLAFDAHGRQRQEAEGRDAPADIPEAQVLLAFKPLLGKVDPDELLAYLHQQAGLLIPRREGVYAFPHRSFQEYLAASYLSNQIDFHARVRQLGEEEMPWWREALLLAIVRGGIGNAVRSMDALLPPSPAPWRPQQTPGESDWRMVGLVGEAAAEIRLVERVDEGQEYGDLLQRIRYWLVRLMEGGQLAAAERLTAGDALGRLGDPRSGVGLLAGVEPSLPDIDWVAIPAGTFTMGSGEDDKLAFDFERPSHPLALPLFYIARYPVTNAQFRPFVEGDGYSNRDYWTDEGWAWRNGAEADLSPIQDHRDEDWKRRYAEWLASRPADKRRQPWYWDDPRLAGATRPVVGISWYEALAWCRWLDGRMRKAGGVLRVADREVSVPASYRVQLPSEAEWEKAARGSDGRLWPWEGGWQAGRANTEEAGLAQTSPVGLFPTGRSAHGLLDMAGNVWQWTRSKWGGKTATPDYGYPYDPGDGREDLDGPDLRIVRGGSWYEEHEFARCAYRYRYLPDVFDNDLGFRVVVSLANSEF